MNCIALSCHMLHSDIEYPVFKQFHMDLQLPNVCLSVDLLIFMCVFLYYHRSIWDVSHSWGNDFTQTPWTDAHNSMQNNETSFRSDSIRNTLNDTHTTRYVNEASKRQRNIEILQLLQQWHWMESKRVKLTHEPKLQLKVWTEIMTNQQCKH